MTDTDHAIVPVVTVEQVIRIIRGQKVILDEDLARLYGTTTKRLNEQVKRNIDRFPSDFMFQLTEDEDQALKSQIATAKTGRGGRRTRPYVFTEHGAMMAASVLNTPRAVAASIYVVRAFVQMREMLSSYAEPSAKLNELDRHLHVHDAEIAALIEAIQRLMIPPDPPQRRIGFRTGKSTEEG